MSQSTEDISDLRQIHIKLPADLHKRLKIQSATEDMSIQDYVVRAIENQISADNSKTTSRMKRTANK